MEKRIQLQVQYKLVVFLKLKQKIVSVNLLQAYIKNKEYAITRDEFEERRNNFNDRAQEKLARQEIENNKYEANHVK